MARHHYVEQSPYRDPIEFVPMSAAAFTGFWVFWLVLLAGLNLADTNINLWHSLV